MASWDDLLLRMPVVHGPGLYYEFDTASSEVVRTGQRHSVKSDTQLDLASGSKLYTAFGAMLTMQLKPEEFYPNKFVNEFAGWQDFSNFNIEGTAERANLTVHQLLTHTSGLPFCLECRDKQDVGKMVLYYRPGEYFGYTVGHRVIGWLLHDFWRRQPEGMAAGIRTIDETFRWLVFDRLGISALTSFGWLKDPWKLAGVIVPRDAGDASIHTTGEDFMRLAVVALRNGSLPSGEQLISRENWNSWAVPNLLPGGKLTEQLVSWQGTSASFLETVKTGDLVSQSVMKKSGSYGWNYFGATYNSPSEVGWCGFFSSCLHVSYTQELAFVIMQRDVLDATFKGSKEYMVDNFNGMARSLQCPSTPGEKYCHHGAESTFCARRKHFGPMTITQVGPWTSDCSPWWPWPWRPLEAPDDHRVCYKPFCATERCLTEAEGDSGGTTCPTGYCLVDGLCEPTTVCREDTGGTCEWLPCDSSRGPSSCSSDKKCLCKPGYCEALGTCVPRAPVINLTCIPERPVPVGSCKLVGCDASRGKTSCISGQCFCQEGYCPILPEGQCARGPGGVASTCAPERPVGTCWVLGCAASRGKTRCSGSKCFCQEGYCPYEGRCMPRALLPDVSQLAANAAAEGRARVGYGAVAFERELPGLAVAVLGAGLLCAVGARISWLRRRAGLAQLGASQEALLAAARGGGAGLGHRLLDREQ